MIGNEVSNKRKRDSEEQDDLLLESKKKNLEHLYVLNELIKQDQYQEAWAWIQEYSNEALLSQILDIHVDKLIHSEDENASNILITFIENNIVDVNANGKTILALSITAKKQRIIEALASSENFDWHGQLEKIPYHKLMEALQSGYKVFNEALFKHVELQSLMKSSASFQSIQRVVDDPKFEIGKLQEAHVRLIVAAICNRKKLPAPKFLIGEDFQIYCHFLRAHDKPILERFFIYSKFHWQSGLAHIGDDLTVKLFINGSVENYCFREIQIFSEIFKNTNAVLYTPKESLQKSGSGCSVFALDAWYQEQKINSSYLPEQFQGDLLEYLKHNSSQGIFPIHKKVTLPLYLMQSMQSRDLYTKIIPDRSDENNLVINRKGQTPLESFRRYFLNDRNHRINARLVKMSKKVNAYLQECAKEDVVESVANIFPRIKH